MSLIISLVQDLYLEFADPSGNFNLLVEVAFEKFDVAGIRRHLVRVASMEIHSPR